ncbi:hypothetical protein M426DRAFT_65010 [Hypoxylon sp. CI-4A]|nr:hypothetical protein M426DRAFT_65010 [Hypoxylon sp. CI-4A]
MAPTVVLITGPNRGIGNGLLKLYLARPNHTVIAANRDPDHPSSKALYDIPRGESTSLLIVKIDSTVRTDPSDAVKTLKSKGIDHIDILIANAAIALSWPKVRDADTDEIQEHVVVNIYGFLWLFQAFYSLLKAAEKPKWVTIGSSAGYLTNATYAPTKTVQHWYTKAIHIEEPWLTAFPVDPGWVQTNMGDRGAHAFGQEKAAITVDESVNGIIKVVDAASRETHSGKIWVYTGKESAW